MKNYKFRILISILTCVVFAISFKNTEKEPSTILWTNNYKLKWDDFQGKQDSLRKNIEEESMIKTRIEVTTKISKSSIEFQTPCYFEKANSWTINDSSLTLLNHEQLHFDITEIFARELRKKLSTIKFTSNQNLKNKVKELYHKINSASIEFQHKYDKETNHSKNKSQQLIWNERIQDILKNTSDYSSIKIVIKK